ncbi:MAG: hypothetical protein ACFCUX_03970 [Candidatus Methylacidiphilales bacterium]
MKRLDLIIGLMCLGLAAETVEARRDVVRVVREQSRQHEVEITGRDAGVNQRWIKIADETLVVFAKEFGLRRIPASRVRIQWRPESGNEGEEWSDPEVFPRSVSVASGKIVADVSGYGSGAVAEVKLRRTLVVLMLQALAWEGAETLTLAEWPDPPLWMSEGVLGKMRVEKHEEWLQAVTRAGRTGHLPSIKTIQGWSSLDVDPLEKIWRQAFCWRLYTISQKARSDSQAMMLWLKRELRQPAPGPYWEDTASVESWWREAVAGSRQDRRPVLDWSKSVSALNELKHVSLVMDPGGRKILRLEDLPQGQRVDRRSKEVEEYRKRWSLANSRAHHMLVPVMEAYQTAFTHWLEGRYEAYRVSLDRAGLIEKSTLEQHQAALDMLDWTQVNVEFGLHDTAGTDFVAAVRRLENERLVLRKKWLGEMMPSQP